jgi:hypothetical protein
MRRAWPIVNEMEFRMWRNAKSFSPPAHMGTMKGFSQAYRFTDRAIDSVSSLILSHLRLRTSQFLESGTSLKRHCLPRAQYGQPFH